MNYHDMLARQGAGSAHPGGFAATLEFLSHFPIRRGSRVLEVGCGTGRTACHLARKGCEVTGLDIRPSMLAKAQKRAELEGVRVCWIEGDVCHLPFAADQFDVVMAESVTVFADAKRVLSEYNRVLRTGGSLYDREMMATKRLPRKADAAVRKLYGVRQVPSLDGWIALLRAANFQEAGVWKPTAVPPDGVMADEWAYPDPYRQIDEDVYTDPGIRYIMERNARVMARYAEYLGYGVLLGTKK